MGNLSNLYISESYQSLIHLATNNTASATSTELQDGSGNGIGIFVNTTGALSASSYSGSVNGIGNVSAFSTSVDSRILAITSSTINTGSLVTTASFNSYTSSQDFKNTTFATTSSLTNLSASLYFTDTTQSVNISNISTSVGLLQTFSGSQYKADSSSFNSRILAITSSGGVPAGTVSSSTQITEFGFATTGSNTFIGTNTFNQQVDIKSGSAILFYSNTNDIANSIGIRDTSGSLEIVKNGSASKVNLQNLSLLVSGGITASGNISSSGNVYGTNINSLTALTASTAYTNVNNTFNGTQSFDNVVVTGTASVAFLNVTYQSSSVIYSSGSNILGDEANVDTQTLVGRVIMTGSAEVTGSLRVSNNVTITGSLTASGLKYPTTDGTAGQFILTDGVGTLAFDDIHSLLEDVRYGEDITLGDPLYVSGSNGTRPIVFKADASNPAKMPVIYIAKSTGVTNTNTTALTLGLITGVTTTGYAAGTTIYVAEGGGWSSSRPSGSASIVQPLGIVTKEGAGGSGRGLILNAGPALLPNLQTGYAWVGNGSNQPVAVATSSFIDNQVTSASFNAFTQSTNAFTASITSSYNATSSSLNSVSSSLVTVSSSLNNVSSSLVAVSGATYTNTNTIIGINAKTASYATTGSNSLTGSQIITGSLTITGSVATPPVALSVTSNTASIDFSKGSIYTLTLPSASVATYVTASNITPGQTANLLVTQASALSGSIVWASAFKFPTGSAYTGSKVVNAVDLISFITVNNTTIYSVGAQNLV